MGNTIYASFADPSLAEKAAGALLDHGVRSEDLSIVSSHADAVKMAGGSSSGTWSADGKENDVKNAGDAAWGTGAAAVDKAQEWGARGMAGINDALGNDAGEAKWEAEADRQNASARQNMGGASGELNNAIDNPNAPSGSTGTSWSSGDGDNDAKNAGDAAMGTGAAAVDKAQEWGARGMAGINDALGNDSGEAKWEAEADRQNASARQNMGNAEGEFKDSVDANGTTSSGYTSTTSREVDKDYVDADKTEAAAKQGISTTTSADAGAGAIKGAGWGLGVGALAALASLIIPGVGIVLGGGALAAALGGVAAATGAGAAAGAVTGYLKDQGVDHHVAADYDRTIQSGGALVAVNAPSGDCSREQIMDILSKYGASNVNAYDVRSSGGYVA
ncbi:MAG TPA: hypothetical protein VK934_03605 [Fimbriimonas sp.]|nr:hypothetical protein [Fimbriimonas sp.]